MCIGRPSELHKTTKDTVNPAYHTITDDHCKKPMEKSINCHVEVNIPVSSDVEMTQNPAYTIP